MGVFARAVKAGVGWPAVGWAPPAGYLGDSITGMTINADTAMSVNAFSAGIRLIAEDIASMPLIVYRRLAKGKERAPEHPAYAMLHDTPNPEMTSMVFRETGVGHLYSWGNWYAEKELNGFGVPVRLWPLRPDKMVVEFDTATGKRVYKYVLPDGGRVIIPANRVFHVPGFGFDGLIGYSRIRLMRRVLEGAKVVEEYGLRTFANDARPGVAIKHPEQLTAAAKKNIAESWDEAHAGLSNAQRTAVLDEGMSIELMGFPPEDAQFLDSRRLSTEDIARGLRLPPHKLSDMSRATFSNIEESNIDYVVGTLGPPCVRIHQQINKDIIGDPAYFAEHLMEGLLRGRFKDRVDAEVQLRLNGLATDEELRELENRNPLTDAERAGLLLPLNSVPASAFDASGTTMVQRVNNAAVLARAGYDPAEALAAFNLPPIVHTGFLPVTVQQEQAIPSTNGKSEPEPETKGFHMHMDAGAFAAQVVLPESITIPAPPAPIVHVAAPIVTTQAPDLREMTEGLTAIKERLDTPVEKTLIRDPVTGAILGSVESRRRPEESA